MSSKSNATGSPSPDKIAEMLNIRKVMMKLAEGYTPSQMELIIQLAIESAFKSGYMWGLRDLQDSISKSFEDKSFFINQTEAQKAGVDNVSI